MVDIEFLGKKEKLPREEAIKKYTYMRRLYKDDTSILKEIDSILEMLGNADSRKDDEEE